jgi:putative membrane protein
MHAQKIWKGLAAGAAAGLAASYVMTQFQNAWTKIAQSDSAEQGQGQEEENATVKAARKISEGVFDHPLSDSEKEKAGNAIHYAFGAAVGAVYGLTAELMPKARSGFGLPFGAALFVAADEVGVPAFGLSKPPQEIPLGMHVYGLASHIVYGATTEALRRGLRALAA